MFFILPFIFSLAGLVITLKILIGYNPEFSFRRKISIASLLVLAWFGPTFCGLIRWKKLLPELPGIYVSQGLHILFVSACFLMIILLLRDFLWMNGYKIAKKCGKARFEYDPMNPAAIKKANVYTVFLVCLLSVYSLYEGLKFPALKETEISTEKVEESFKIVVLTDTHITAATPVPKVEKLVKTVNDLKPDITVLIGDIADGKPAFLEKQMEVLTGLDAKYGVFVTLGNHEFYHGSVEWENKFKKMRLFYLANEGLNLSGTNIFLSGLPDPQLLHLNSVGMELVKGVLKTAKEGSYRIFLSHSPRFIRRLDNDLIDLQISGHTHGGQIFPFHYLVKRFNDFLAGLYDVDGMKLYVSRGAGSWGPPMRLFAPSEISVITLVPSEKQEGVGGERILTKERQPI